MKMRFANVGINDLENLRYNLKLVSPGRHNPNGSVHPNKLGNVDTSFYDPDKDMTLYTWIDIIESKGYDNTHPDIINTQKQIDEIDTYIETLKSEIKEMAENALNEIDELSRINLRNEILLAIQIPVLIKDFSIL